MVIPRRIERSQLPRRHVAFLEETVRGIQSGNDSEKPVCIGQFVLMCGEAQVMLVERREQDGLLCQRESVWRADAIQNFDFVRFEAVDLPAPHFDQVRFGAPGQAGQMVLAALQGGVEGGFIVNVQTGFLDRHHLLGGWALTLHFQI